MSNAKYDKFDNEDRYKRILQNKENAVVEHTNYSTLYKFGKKRFILNEKGEQDVFAFHLLNKTRNDAVRYLKQENPPLKERKTDIVWSYLDTEQDLPHEVSVPILKVDLNEAYWRKAIQLGIVSQETEQAFLDHKFETKKDRKYCRLKALGALATIKRVKAYKFGEPDLIYTDKYGRKTNETLKVNAPLRELYLAVCESVSDDMQNLMMNIEGCMYYYWDCLFIKESDNKQDKMVRQMVQELGYNCTVEKDEAEVLDYGDRQVFICLKTGIEYPVM